MKPRAGFVLQGNQNQKGIKESKKGIKKREKKKGKKEAKKEAKNKIKIKPNVYCVYPTVDSLHQTDTRTKREYSASFRNSYSIQMDSDSAFTFNFM